MKSLAQLNSYFLKYKWHFLLGMAFVILSNYFRLLSPQITGYIVNSVIQLIQKKSNAGVALTKHHSSSLIDLIDSICWFAIDYIGYFKWFFYVFNATIHYCNESTY